MIFVNQVAIDTSLVIAPQTTGALGDTILDIDGQLDASNPATVAGLQADATAYYGELQRWYWSSLAASFAFVGDAPPDLPSNNCVTDWDGIDSDVIADVDLNTGAMLYDEETGIWTVGAAVTGWLQVSWALDAEKTAGGASAWVLSLLRNGVPVGRSRRKELTALNDRQSFDVLFAPVLVEPGDTLCLAAQPEAAQETIVIYQHDLLFTPVRQ